MAASIPDDIVVLLNEIAERLWSGHASVMVGAGFSKNAIRNSNSSKPFLNWNELADIFYEKLHGCPPPNGEHYLNPLKLAEEVCAAFGRPALEKRMQAALPDLDYSPSDIHRDLLELPWNDVFTTNYDTLLERTKVSQRYDVVLHKSDLVFSQRPRIIKLHGSFPSHRPFLITEEDYRKYPRECAPFVNTVQQSLIENTLCLIGFSGDDPNFLSWIGWIRDNLGASSSPRIFLIGVFKLSPSQIKVLEQRNIGVIDLSACVINEPETHKTALQIFIDFLKSKKAEESRLDWPAKESAKYSPSRDLSDEAFVAELRSTTGHWRKTREEYPGWIICPNDSRKSLWMHTSNWLHGRHLKITTTFAVDISFWRELAWRLEKSLSPLYDDTAAAIENVVARYNPFPKKLAFSAEFNREEDSDAHAWEEIASSWLYLNLCLLRFFREEGLREKWVRCSKKLEGCLDRMSASQRDNLRYEQCLFHLFRQDVVEFRKILQSWKPDDSSPFYQAKKAGLLAESGDVDEAKTLLENALQLVRAQLNLTPITTDYTHVSQEAYILQLLKFVKDAVSSFSNEDRQYIEEFSLRWMKLKQYKCDPWGELQLFEARLEGPTKERKVRETEYGFDIGRSSTTQRWGTDKEMLEAYAFLRHMDDIGIPFHIRNVTFGREPAIGAIKRIARSSLNWAIATMLRTGDDKSVDALFDRSFLLGGSLEKTEALVDVLLKMLIDLAEDVERADHWDNRNMGTHYASIIPEILSRLCTRCSLDRLRKILGFLLTVYKSPHKMKYSNINHLAQRLVNSWPPEHLADLISFVISEFPVVGGQHPRLQADFPDLLEFVDQEKSLNCRDKIVVQMHVIDGLLAEFEGTSEDNKEFILNRLIKVFKYGLLSEAQKTKFGLTLWKKIDDTGFPAGSNNLYRWFFLELPHPSDVDVNSVLHVFLSSLKLPAVGAAKSVSISGGQSRPCAEITNASTVLNRIGRCSDDARELLKKISVWWLTDKHFLKSSDKDAFNERSNEFRGRFQKAARAVEVAVIPFLSDQIFRDSQGEIENLVDEMGSLGISVVELRCALFLRSPGGLDHLLTEVELDVLSDDFSRVVRAIIAITNLLDQKKSSALNEVDRTRVLSFMVDAIKWRKVKALIPALANFKLILRYPGVDWEQCISDVLIGLQHLAQESDLSYEDGSIPLHDRLFVRQEAAALSFALYKFYDRKGGPIPPSLETWKAVCHDPGEFAEIRNQWADL